MLSDWMESRRVSLAGGLGVFYEWSRSETEARGQVAAGPDPLSTGEHLQTPLCRGGRGSFGT